MKPGGDEGTRVAAADVRTYVVNLRRRRDRREWMERILPAELPAVFTSDWEGPFDGRSLDLETISGLGHRLFPWRIESVAQVR